MVIFLSNSPLALQLSSVSGCCWVKHPIVINFVKVGLLRWVFWILKVAQTTLEVGLLVFLDSLNVLLDRFVQQAIKGLEALNVLANHIKLVVALLRVIDCLAFFLLLSLVLVVSAWLGDRHAPYKVDFSAILLGLDRDLLEQTLD